MYSPKKPGKVPRAAGLSSTLDGIPKLLKPAEVAEILGVHLNNVYALIRRERIPVIYVGRRAYRVPLDGLRRWIAEHTEEGC